MPDWTYHPFFKPLLFQLRPETGRRLTLGLLTVQAQTGPGRWPFRLFGHGLPPLAITWWGIKPGAKRLWYALTLSGSIGFACAIGVHPIVGYNSFVHLLPAYLGAIAFLYSCALLYRPLCAQKPSQKFADF